MDSKQIQKRVDDLAAAMLAKEMVCPHVTLMMKSNAEPVAHMEWADDSAPYGTAYDTVRAATVSEVLDKASAFIAARPSAEQARLGEFMRALSKAVDIGKKHGIDADYLNPLVASMKKLSENALTHQEAA